MNENVIKMARIIGGCNDITCEDCLSKRKKLFGDNKCALIEYAEAFDKAGYRKQEDTVREFAEKLKDTITEEIALCEQKRSELLYGGQWIILTEKKIVLMVQIKMLNELAEQYGKEG